MSKSFASFNSAVTTMYDRAIYGAIETHEDAFRQQNAMARTKQGNYLCCEYCGTGWDNDRGRCMACGAPAADALRSYILMLEGEDKAYASAPQYGTAGWASTDFYDDTGAPMPSYDTVMPYAIEYGKLTEAWFDKDGLYRTGPKPPDFPEERAKRVSFMNRLVGWFGA